MGLDCQVNLLRGRRFTWSAVSLLFLASGCATPRAGWDREADVIVPVGSRVSCGPWIRGLVKGRLTTWQSCEGRAGLGPIEILLDSTTRRRMEVARAWPTSAVSGTVADSLRRALTSKYGLPIACGPSPNRAAEWWRIPGGRVGVVISETLILVRATRDSTDTCSAAGR